MPSLHNTQPGGVSGKQTILLVEDDSSILSLFSVDLEEQGYHVLRATTSQEAIQICKRHAGPIHLLLTDILLPTNGALQFSTDKIQKKPMHGMELMRHIVGLRPQIRVILMSGQSVEGLKAFYVVNEGKKPFLWKPISTETLVRTVREVLGSPSNA